MPYVNQEMLRIALEDGCCLDLIFDAL